MTGYGTMRTSFPSRSNPNTQQHGGQQVLHAVLHHQRDDHHGHRSGGAGHHARPTAEQRSQGADDKSAIKPHQRIEVGHQGESDAFGQQREGCGEPGQGIGAQTLWFHGLPEMQTGEIGRRESRKKRVADVTELQPERPVTG
jgi:hypothetical protein